MFGIEKEKEKHETFPSLSLFRGAINYIQDDFDSCKSHHCWLTKRVIPSPFVFSRATITQKYSRFLPNKTEKGKEIHFSYQK